MCGPHGVTTTDSGGASDVAGRSNIATGGEARAQLRELSPALAPLNVNLENKLRRPASTAEFDGCQPFAACGRHTKASKPVVPAARVDEQHTSFYEDESEDEDYDGPLRWSEDEDEEEEGERQESPGVLQVLAVLAQKKRDQELAAQKRPLVGDGEAAAADAARVASCKRGVPLAFGGC